MRYWNWTEEIFYLRFEQPDLVKTDGTFAYGLGSCSVQWNFGDGKVTSEFVFKVKNQVSLDKMRLALVIGSPHQTQRRHHSSSGY